MKKLLTIILLTLSPFTFAEDFNPDLLVGKWQCKSELIFDNGNIKYPQTSQQTFNENGTYESEDSLYSQSLDKDIKSKSKGKWYIKGNILSVNTEEIRSLSAEKPNSTDVNTLEGKLINKDEVAQLLIKKFPLSKFVLSWTKKDQIELQGNTIDTCERIKE